MLSNTHIYLDNPNNYFERLTNMPDFLSKHLSDSKKSFFLRQFKETNAEFEGCLPARLYCGAQMWHLHPPVNSQAHKYLDIDTNFIMLSLYITTMDF